MDWIGQDSGLRTLEGSFQGTRKCGSRSWGVFKMYFMIFLCAKKQHFLQHAMDCSLHFSFFPMVVGHSVTPLCPSLPSNDLRDCANEARPSLLLWSWIGPTDDLWTPKDHREGPHAPPRRSSWRRDDRWWAAPHTSPVATRRPRQGSEANGGGGG